MSRRQDKSVPTTFAPTVTVAGLEDNLLSSFNQDPHHNRQVVVDLMRPLLREFVRPYTEEWRAVRSVLEIGAGPGILRELCSEAAPGCNWRWNETDIDEAALTRSSGTCTRVCAATEVDQHFSEIDLVVSLSTLDNLGYGTLPAVFKALFESLQPGGRLVAFFDTSLDIPGYIEENYPDQQRVTVPYLAKGGLIPEITTGITVTDRATLDARLPQFRDHLNHQIFAALNDLITDLNSPLRGVLREIQEESSEFIKNFPLVFREILQSAAREARLEEADLKYSTPAIEIAAQDSTLPPGYRALVADSGALSLLAGEPEEGTIRYAGRFFVFTALKGEE